MERTIGGVTQVLAKVSGATALRQARCRQRRLLTLSTAKSASESVDLMRTKNIGGAKNRDGGEAKMQILTGTTAPHSLRAAAPRRARSKARPGQDTTNHARMNVLDAVIPIFGATLWTTAGITAVLKL